MWSRFYLSQTGSRVALLLGQFIVIAFCLTYIEIVYFNRILPDKIANETFQPVDCFLVNKKLNTKTVFYKSYRADFLITYNVEGVQYSRWATGNGLDRNFTTNMAEQTTKLGNYNVGQAYTCYYDPQNPEVAVFMLRQNWQSTFPLMVPSVVAIITFYYFLINLFVLMGTTTVKTREIIKARREKRIRKKNENADRH